MIIGACRRCGVLGLVRPVGISDNARDVLVKPLPATIGLDRGVGPDLRAINRDRAEPGQSRPRSDHQHLREQVAERLLRIDSEPGDRGVVGTILGTEHSEGDIGQRSRSHR